MLGQELKKRVHGKERCLWKPRSEEEKKREGNLESYKTKGNQKIGGHTIPPLKRKNFRNSS